MPLYPPQPSAFGASLGQAADAAAARALLNSFPRLLFKSNLPFVIPTSGTMGNNGALSGITALAQIYAQAYTYLPANAIVAGSAAGWYYTVYSSTTAGTVYNNLYDPAVGGEALAPASPTAFATTGPGAFAQDVAAGHQAQTYIMPANTLTSTGRLRFEISVKSANSANVKSIVFRSGATALPASLSLASVTGNNMNGFINAVNSTALAWVGYGTSQGGGSTTQPGFQLALNLTTALTLNVFPLTSNVADWLVVTHVAVWQDA